MKAFPDIEKGALFNSPGMITIKSRPLQGAILILLLIVLTFTLNSLDHARNAGRSILNHYQSTFSKAPGDKPGESGVARRLYPKDLMRRPLATDLTSMPKLLHQSWVNDTMPAKFEEWSNSCRMANPDWEWILWTDEDNRKLVEKYAPWFMSTYDFLRSEIYRADTARNIYMHVFGGVYADLDTECLLPYNSLFKNHDLITVESYGAQDMGSVSTDNERNKALTDDSDVSITAERKAFVGRMGIDERSLDSIPNAWMASTPGHPFWLLPMEAVEETAQLMGMQPEQMTGPRALYKQIMVYHTQFKAGKGNGGIRLDEHYATSEWRHIYKSISFKDLARAPQSLVILPHYEVYPFSWQRDGAMFKDFCFSAEETFDAEKCKALLGLDHWGSHSITYWSHSWSGEGNGHWDEHLEAVSKSNKTHVEKPGGETKGDQKEESNEKKEDTDAIEANRRAEGTKNKQEQEEARLAEQSIGSISMGRRTNG